jgi:chromate transport protein ChrA
MTAFAAGVNALGDGIPTWLLFVENGLVSAAVGLVALAAYKLGTKLLIDPISVFLAVVCASLAINLTTFPWLYAIIMVAGGMTTMVEGIVLKFYHSRSLGSELSSAVLIEPEATQEEQPVILESTQETEFEFGFSYAPRWGYLMFGTWMLVLIAAICMRTLSTVRFVDVFGTSYFVGSIIFGGGPVVVPLLQGYVVNSGWMSNQEFLLGLALINILPGN